MKKTYNVVDMFCGAGGESTGILQAAGELDLKVNLFAINHWERAIETHAANHPGANHLCQSVENINPTRVILGRKLDLLWASPECTHHSIARGGRPRSEQSRASPWMILKWLQELNVERVIIENVKEFLQWGPLDKNGKPIQKLKGETFRAFIAAIKSFGYLVDWKILTCADYGDPTTRQRLFIQAVKGKKHILWPEITHMDGDNLIGYKPWVQARDIIDWSIPGTSIFNRKKPLAPTTMRRIAAGIEKYGGNYKKPFLAILHGASKVNSIDEPLSTITCGGRHHALITPLPPFITAIGQTSAKDRSRSLDEPLSTVVGKQEHVLIEPLIMEYHGTGGVKPVSKPLKTVTTKDRFALITIPKLKLPFGLDIHFRMLKNHELKRAHSFPENYILTGNTTEQTKQIGNSVPVNTAKALAKENMKSFLGRNDG